MDELSEMLIAAQHIGKELKAEGRTGWALWLEGIIAALQQSASEVQTLRGRIKELEGHSLRNKVCWAHQTLNCAECFYDPPQLLQAEEVKP